MACFIENGAIQCYRGIPFPVNSKLRTIKDGKEYLSKYTAVLFKSLKPDSVVELYSCNPNGLWVTKKFIKSYVEFVAETQSASHGGSDGS